MSHFRTRLIKFFILMLLVSSIACGELLELSKLTDDTSNDFAVLSLPSAEILLEVTVQAKSAHCVTVAMPCPQFSEGPQGIDAFRSSRGVLVLHSILRT